VASATAHASAREAVDGADVVITAASFTTPARRQVLTNEWLTPDALVVAVDYATYVASEVALEAGAFLVDERGQFVANRDAGQFDAYPDPTMSIGEAIRSAAPRPPGRVLVTHLGVGLADLVFADAVVRGAEQLGLGTELPR
jgi:ornithine cyclodeaminase/alanine dehydrogenase-like protein (mu-crystallin family)